MAAANSFTLIGTLAGTPTIKATRGGKEMAIVVLSVPVIKYAGGGTQTENADFEFTCFGRTAETVKGLAEGQLVAVTGDVESRVYQRGAGGTGLAINLTGREITVIDTSAKSDDNFSGDWS